MWPDDVLQTAVYMNSITEMERIGKSILQPEATSHTLRFGKAVRICKQQAIELDIETMP